MLLFFWVKSLWKLLIFKVDKSNVSIQWIRWQSNSCVHWKKKRLNKWWKRKRLYLHSEEGYTGEQIHCGLEVLQSLRTAGREVVLQSGQKKERNQKRRATVHEFTSVLVQFFESVGTIQHGQSSLAVSPVLTVWAYMVSRTCLCTFPMSCQSN